jgi:hypothetical protein
VKSKREAQPGDGVDVRVIRLLSRGILDGVVTREEWIPGDVQRIDDTTVTIYVYGLETRAYPIESSDWRLAK